MLVLACERFSDKVKAMRLIDDFHVKCCVLRTVSPDPLGF